MTETERSITIHRVFNAPIERVYRAFVDPAAKEYWEPPYGFLGRVHEWDFQEGGIYRMTYTHFATGKVHVFGGRFLEIVENERLKMTDNFDDASLSGEIVTTVSFKVVGEGTDVHISQTGIPAEIPQENCYVGWQQSMIQLAQLVETDPAAATES